MDRLDILALEKYPIHRRAGVIPPRVWLNKQAGHCRVDERGAHKCAPDTTKDTPSEKQDKP